MLWFFLWLVLSPVSFQIWAWQYALVKYLVGFLLYPGTVRYVLLLFTSFCVEVLHVHVLPYLSLKCLILVGLIKDILFCFCYFDISHRKSLKQEARGPTLKSMEWCKLHWKFLFQDEAAAISLSPEFVMKKWTGNSSTCTSLCINVWLYSGRFTGCIILQ